MIVNRVRGYRVIIVISVVTNTLPVEIIDVTFLAERLACRYSPSGDTSLYRHSPCGSTGNFSSNKNTSLYAYSSTKSIFKRWLPKSVT